MNYRIDALQGHHWETGRVTFHADTPLSALEDVACNLARVLRRPVRIVRVRETVLTSVEPVREFQPPT